MKETIKKYLIRRSLDYNINNDEYINELSNIAKDLDIKINDSTIKKVIKHYNEIYNYKKSNKTKIEYWINKGHLIQEAQIKIKHYNVIKNNKNKVKNNFDISNFNKFLTKCNKLDILKRFNFDNLELLKKYYLELNLQQITSDNTLSKSLLKVINKYRSKRGTPTSLEYWISLGWSKEKSQAFVSDFQRSASHWSLQYWINKGYTEEQAKIEIRNRQYKNNKKFNTKYSKDERSEMSCYNIKFWLNKGYSEEEAKLKLRQLNPSCIEFYNYDYELYNKRLKAISKNVKNNWEKGKYNTQKYINGLKQSKEEIQFFEYVKDLNIIHKPFYIQEKDPVTKLKHIAIYDGYYKTDNGIILFEYDGIYWHDENKDIIRDFKTFLYRNDIIGIIRIQCKYFKRNKKNIIKELNESINKIKSSKEKRIKLY